MRVFGTQQHIVPRRSTIGEKHRLGYVFINQLTNSSTLRPLRCGACCTTHLLTHLHERILLPWSVRASLTNWECCRFCDFKRSFRRLSSGNSLNSELKHPPPHAFGIPNCVTPPRLRNSSPRNPPLSLRIPRCRPWYGMDIFWNHPMLKNASLEKVIFHWIPIKTLQFYAT